MAAGERVVHRRKGYTGTLTGAEEDCYREDCDQISFEVKWDEPHPGFYLGTTVESGFYCAHDLNFVTTEKKATAS